MFNKISSREKVLLVILIVLIIASMWYMLFYTPTQEKKARYEAELLEMEDTIILAEARVAHMRKMKSELEALTVEGAENEIKETPLYDNSRKLMENLNLILMSAVEYSISFSEITEKEQIARRDVALNYQCRSYEQAKEILTNIRDGKYPCIIKDVNLSFDELYRVTVNLTYFEYVQ